MIIPLPPFPEQIQITDEIEWRLSIVDNNEKAIKRSLKQSESLRQGILRAAFKGELLLQDPTEEPARLLLQRIKEDKLKSYPREIRIKSKVDNKQLKLF